MYNMVVALPESYIRTEDILYHNFQTVLKFDKMCHTVMHKITSDLLVPSPEDQTWLYSQARPG